MERRKPKDRIERRVPKSGNRPPEPIRTNADMRIVGRKYLGKPHSVFQLGPVKVTYKVRAENASSLLERRDYFVGTCHLGYGPRKADGFYMYLTNASEETAIRGRYFKDETAMHDWLKEELLG